jgi:SAM-dependent methyltransferase
VAFDSTWEHTHQTSLWGQYPNEPFTFLVNRLNVPPEKHKDVKFLDIGCGQGANSWFLAREGYNVTALDGSASALAKVYERFRREHLAGQLVHADLTEPLPFPDNTFDVVVDVHASCYSTLDEMHRTFKEISRVLVPGGRLFSHMPRAGCDNARFHDRGVVTCVDHHDIALFMQDFYAYSLMSTACYDHHHKLSVQLFMEWWTLEAVKGS